MSEKDQKRKYFFANSLHRRLFWLFFLMGVVPALITAIGLYFFIFSITAQEIGFPEAIANYVLPAAWKVTQVLIVVVTAAIAVLLKIAHRMSHRMVGPYGRIVRELDECIAGTRAGPLKLRQADAFEPLVDRINTILKKLKSRR